MTAPFEAGHAGERLRALVDRELSAADEASVYGHLRGCASCATEHARLVGTLSMLGALGRARAPQGFAARVLRRFRRGDMRLRRLPQKVPFEGTIIVLLAAAAAASMMAYGWHVHQTLAAAEDPPTLERR